MDRLIGQRLDNRYLITRLLGEGGMGGVYSATDTLMQMDVALKVLHERLARQPQFRQRFLQEARAAHLLNHPGIVRIYNYGETNTVLYIVMELIRGGTLYDLMSNLRAKQQWIDLAEAIHLIREVALALDHAHQQRVLHRDIKPANIMIREQSRDGQGFQPVLTDLGLAKLAEDGITTVPGAAMGTPAYMSPEQALGEEVDARSDVYSLGILMYELVVGQLPFAITSLSQAIRYHAHEAPPPPRSLHPELPLQVETVLLKALAKDPAARYDSAKAMAEALAALGVAPFTYGAPRQASGGMSSLLTEYRNSLVVTPSSPSTPSNLSQGVQILVQGPGGEARSLHFQPPRMTIGRNQDNHIVLEDSRSSRHHARIDFDGNRFTVTDLGSTNGTLLGRTALPPHQPTTWSPDVLLRIGNHALRLHTVAPRGGLVLLAEQSEVRLSPGGQVQVPLTIENSGNQPAQVVLNVTVIPQDWVAALPPLTVAANSQQNVTISVKTPPASRPVQKRYTLTIQATNQHSPDNTAHTAMILLVNSNMATVASPTMTVPAGSSPTTVAFPATQIASTVAAPPAVRARRTWRGPLAGLLFGIGVIGGLLWVFLLAGNSPVLTTPPDISTVVAGNESPADTPVADGTDPMDAPDVPRGIDVAQGAGNGGSLSSDGGRDGNEPENRGTNNSGSIASMPAASSTPTPTHTATGTASPAPPTSTSVPTPTLIPTETSMPSPTPTSTDSPPTPTPSSTHTSRPPDTPTAEPPTATFTPMPPTPTPLPPTDTPTPAPPTATFTPAPPTNTPAPQPPGVVNSFETFGVWQRGRQEWGTFVQNDEQAHSGRYAGKVDYHFPAAAGNDNYVVFLQEFPLPGQPTALTIWVYGDGQGSFLNVWIKDNTSQHWQFTFGQVKHTGWQQMAAQMDVNQGWPNGKVLGDTGATTLTYPLRFAGLVVDGVPDGADIDGLIYVDDLATATEVVLAPTPVAADGGVSTPQPSTSDVATLPVEAPAALSGRLAYTEIGSNGNYDTIIYNFADSSFPARFSNLRQPAFSPSGYLIANGEGGDQNDLVRMNPNYGNQRLISTHPEDAHPHWSPSGVSIAFDSTFQGDGRHRVYWQADASARQEAEPLYFGGGEIFGRYPIYLENWRIAYQGCNTWADASACGIYTTDTRGSQPLRASDRTSDIPSDALGSQILFTSEREGNWDVYIVNWDGSGLRRLTTSPARDGLATASPDGRHIAFVSERDGLWGIWIMNSDGTDQRKLFDLNHGYGRGDKDWLQERLSWGP